MRRIAIFAQAVVVGLFGALLLGTAPAAATVTLSSASFADDCQGTDITITSGPSPAGTYEWEVAFGESSVTPTVAAGQTQLVTVPADAGEITVSVTNAALPGTPPGPWTHTWADPGDCPTPDPSPSPDPTPQVSTGPLPTPEASATPSPDPAIPAGVGGDQLPQTGSVLVPLGILGGLMLAGGAALAWASGRRRQRATFRA